MIDSVELENVSFSYNEEAVLQNISTKLVAGTQYALIGSNGSGKSTLAKLISGLLTPCTGKIKLAGAPLTDFSTKQLAQNIRYIFQNPDDQIFNPTVYKEITYGYKNFDTEWLKEILKLTNLSTYTKRSPYELSPSDRKFVAIASALLAKPQIIIFDEVTSGLDLAQKQLIEQILKYLNSVNATTIFITHDMEFVYKNFPETIILYNKSLIYQGNTVSAFTNELLMKKAKLEAPLIVKLFQASYANDDIATPLDKNDILPALIRKINQVD